MDHQTIDLTALSRELKSAAAGITDEWLERLTRDLASGDRELPVEELRDRVPELLEAVASCVETGRLESPGRHLDRFRRLTRLRLEQGEDIQDLLAELAVLAHVVFDRATAWVRDSDLDAAATLEMARQLNDGVLGIVRIAVRTHQDRQKHQERAVIDFARMIGHELASPLNAATVSAELLERPAIGGSPDSRREHLERVQGSLARIQRLVDDIRAATLTERPAGGETVNLRRVVEEVFNHLEGAARRRDVRLQVDEPFHDIPVDRAVVEIPIMNLVSNAIKYSDPGVTDRWVRVGATRTRGHTDGAVRIAVSDNGIGIPAEAASRVFDRFFRVDPAVEGSGLGLAITKRLVESGHGRIWFDSELGRGTTFFVELRVASVADPASQG